MFGLTWAKPLSIGPYDLTNVIVGVLYGLGLARGVTDLWREDDLRLAIRVATGGAFVLAGLGNAFYMNGPVDYFVAVGYTKSFHYFIMTAEVLGGAALLLPWRWLTLAVRRSWRCSGSRPPEPPVALPRSEWARRLAPS